MELKKLQEQLFKAITLRENEEQALSLIKENGSVSREDRLEIYQYAYKERVKECIEDDFPLFCEIVNESDFSELYDHFLKTELSEYWNINGFTSLWNQYIQKSECEDNLKSLSRYEWLKVESFYKHNRKEEPLFKNIVLSEEHNAQVRIDDSVIITTFQHKILEAEEDTALPKLGERHIIFWTRQFSTQTGYLTEIEFHLAKSLCHSSNLDQVIADMSKLNIDDVTLAENFQRAIASFMEKGILIQI